MTRTILVPLAFAILSTLSPAQTTERASLTNGGGQASGASGQYGLAASDDGRYVTFSSFATDLVAGDLNGMQDVFLRDRLLGTTVLVSLAIGGAQGNGMSDQPSISADGQVVAFASSSSNFASDTNGLPDVFVRYLSTGITVRYSTSSFGGEGNAGGGAPRISADGVWVVFHSTSTNLVAGDVNGKQDVFIHRNQLTELVSVSTAGVQANDHCWSPVVSADGRFVLFYSAATNLVAGDLNGVNDVFLRDRQLGTTELVSKSTSGTLGNDHSMAGFAVSNDGRFVVFGSQATFLVPGDANGSAQDVFLRDRLLGTTEFASVSSAGTQGNTHSLYPWISGDGRFITFHSTAANLVPNKTNFGANDVYVRDRVSGITERVSTSTSGAEGNGDSIAPWISNDGRFVSFASNASTLVAGDTNAAFDAFLHDRGAAGASPTICPGDGTVAACPCGNSGIAGHGCQNSALTNGATLAVHGSASLS